MDGLNLPINETDQRSKRLSRRRSPKQEPLAQRVLRRLPLFVFVVLPTAVASIYYFGFAANQYVSEAHFVVRGPGSTQPGVLSSLIEGASHAQDDTFSVQEYILSRDALHKLVDHDDLLTVFSRPEADVLSRFPPPVGGTTFEHLFKYYTKQVDVAYDPTTGVSTLTVKAFRADDAQRIAQALLTAGERLINQMNDRERENTLKSARAEVARAEARITQVASNLAAFRKREVLLDPDKQSIAMLQGINDLQSKLAVTKTQIAEMMKSAPNSPLVTSGLRRQAALQSQINEAEQKIAGSGESMVPKITEYDQLALERNFADRALASATDSLAAARLQAERQELYLDPIVQPDEPDYPAYPKRFASVALVFATCFGVYTSVRLLIAAAREHHTT